MFFLFCPVLAVAFKNDMTLFNYFTTVCGLVVVITFGIALFRRRNDDR